MPRPKKSTPPPRSPKKKLLDDKTCYSCKRKDTPYWREGWRPSVILCNACGLRYSKYRRVCTLCNKVGVKANFEKVSCPKCKSTL
ncbi:hypothetical protein VCUG_02060 [Vavraia culicis subsp. floridensis]|uniref:GATA-type domain-containing protein n=1 Tax=Vavraia culicis (isolate floridensis) TaxID=948595 RepID=L2GTP9_VAVCU|nr:uncharacterized protein VCUG_02060 [Vavraia culicis subsp. floridensis]ELA46465.1 hypothetical protein VCUG_02060 [Vavraia culicis subsp. floridensis]